MVGKATTPPTISRSWINGSSRLSIHVLHDGDEVDAMPEPRASLPAEDEEQADAMTASEIISTPTRPSSILPMYQPADARSRRDSWPERSETVGAATCRGIGHPPCSCRTSVRVMSSTRYVPECVASDRLLDRAAAECDPTGGVRLKQHVNVFLRVTSRPCDG